MQTALTKITLKDKLTCLKMNKSNKALFKKYNQQLNKTLLSRMKENSAKILATVVIWWRYQMIVVITLIITNNDRIKKKTQIGS